MLPAVLTILDVLRRREQLSAHCKVMLFDHEVRMGESIDFQIPMKWACTAGETRQLTDCARPPPTCHDVMRQQVRDISQALSDHKVMGTRPFHSLLLQWPVT